MEKWSLKIQVWGNRSATALRYCTVTTGPVSGVGRANTVRFLGMNYIRAERDRGTGSLGCFVKTPTPFGL